MDVYPHADALDNFYKPLLASSHKSFRANHIGTSRVLLVRIRQNATLEGSLMCCRHLQDKRSLYNQPPDQGACVSHNELRAARRGIAVPVLAHLDELRSSEIVSFAQPRIAIVSGPAAGLSVRNDEL